MLLNEENGEVLEENREVLYAQLDENGKCTCVSTYNTGIEATLKNLGQTRVWIEPTTKIEVFIDSLTESEVEREVPIDGYWDWQGESELYPTNTIVPYEPKNSEVVQLINDLYADLIINGVIV